MVLATENQKLYRQCQYSSAINQYLSKDRVVANLKSRLEMQKCEAKELVSSSQFGKLHQLLTSAEKKGSFDERHDLLESITGLLANTIAKNHGQRWVKFPVIMQLLEAVTITGSTCAATILGSIMGCFSKNH